MHGDHLSVFKDNKGSAFIIVIISMAVLLILATTIASIAVSNFEMGHAERRYQAAYYVAEAGIRHQIEHMRLRTEELHRSGGHTSAGPFFTSFNQGWVAMPLVMQNLGVDSARADIIMPSPEIPPITGTGNIRTYTFDSRATVGNVRRTIRGSITIEWALMQAPPVFFERALFADNNIYMSGGTRITGGAGTNASAPGSVELEGGARIEGGVLLGPGSNQTTVVLRGGSQITGGTTISTALLPMPDIVFPEGLQPRGSLNLRSDQIRTINEDGRYSTIDLEGASRLIFDLTNRDLRIRVDGALQLRGGSSIITQGNGRLYLFIQGDVNVEGGTHINPERSPNHLIMFVMDNVTMRGGTSIRGGIYAPNAIFDMEGGTSFTGSSMVSELHLSGGASVNFSTIDNAGVTQYLGSIPGFVPPERMFVINPWREP